MRGEEINSLNERAFLCIKTNLNLPLFHRQHIIVDLFLYSSLLQLLCNILDLS